MALIRQKQEQLTQLKQFIEDEYGVKFKDIKARTRVPDLVNIRFVAWHTLRTHFGWTIPEIGTAFNRDASVVQRGINSLWVTARRGEFRLIHDEVDKMVQAIKD